MTIAIITYRCAKNGAFENYRNKKPYMQNAFS